MDALFDIQYCECDPKTRMDDDTPLHIAVRYANDKDRELGTEMVKMMCDAGCDPRVRNKFNQKPVELVFNNDEIKQALLEGGARGMHTFDQHLAQLVEDGLMTEEDALQSATSPHELKIMLMKRQFA